MKLFILLISFIFVSGAFANPEKKPKKKVRYKTSFGFCPSRSAGALALRLMKTFEETRSLVDLKRQIIDEKLQDKYFLNTYNVNFDPITNSVKFKFDCPKPLMKVQVYRDSGAESYEAILVQNGKLYDPTYEMLLKEEKKVKEDLPALAMPVEQLNEKRQYELSDLIETLDQSLLAKFSEVILDKEGSLTMILSLKGRPSSVFLGSSSWSEKITKLQKIVSYMESKNKIPAVINLINSKKVVVKFSDTI